ncbi:MAG: OsmC family protein [Deltaproteobacteria bacterium]|nr:OsmC family protein [Deltaproteobacteria bacterium]
MARATEILVTLPGGRRVDARVGHHLIHTDQPTTNGGEDTAPAPFELFLASIGACAGIFVQGFCAKRGIPFENIRIFERPNIDDDGVLRSVGLEIDLPADFPERYKDAVIKVAGRCTVKAAIAAQPVFEVTAKLRTPLLAHA